MRSQFASSIALCFVLGCHGDSRQDEESPGTSGGEEEHGTRGARVVSASPGRTNGQIQVRIEASRSGHPISFSPGSGLRSGDRFVVFVRADRSLYVHVLQFFPDGSSAILSSTDGQPVLVSA